MNITRITPETFNNLIDQVKQVFPDWQSFEDPRFNKEEVTYKQKAIQKAKALLKESELRDCITQGNFEDFIDRLVKVAQSGKNLLYLATPKQGDLSVLYQENLNKPAFCQAFIDLIYGSGSSPERLEKYLFFIQKNNLPNKWTFPTYFLFVCQPEKEMYVKPQAMQWFLKSIGMFDKLSSSPSKELYNQILEVCKQLWNQLENYHPRDYVDIEGFIWTVYTANQSKHKLAQPFILMFKNWKEAEWAFDLIQTAMGYLEIQNPDNLLYAVTCRYYPGGRRIRLTYGNWLVLGINGKASSITSIHIALFKDTIDIPVINEEDFGQASEENKVALFNIAFDDFLRNEEVILELFEKTMAFVKQKFRNWKGGVFHRYNILQLATAILQPELREGLLTQGIEITNEAEDTINEGIIRYWKISPGENAWNWEACKNGGFISLGWDEVGDISGISREEFDDRVKKQLEIHSDWGPKGIEQVWTFAHIQEGDRIVANQGTKVVLGIGTVIGPYQFLPETDHGHHLPVRWDDQEIRSVNKGHWVKTIFELSKIEFDEIVNSSPTISTVLLFDEHTFILLEQLHNNPTQAFYNMHKEEFKNKIELPFQKLMHLSAENLRDEILDFMETEKKLFSRFQRNDFGKMGAWDYYWGAFYPKGGKRTGDAQLSLLINYEQLEIGFYIGDYGETQRNRFRKNCLNDGKKLFQWLTEIVTDPSIGIGNQVKVSMNPDGSIVANNKVSWEDWFRDPEEFNYNLSIILPKVKVLSLSSDELIEMVTEIYNRLFPFIILATSDDPLPLIAEYLAVKQKPEIQPTYSLDRYSEETGVDITNLKKWVKAIDRKKQVVFFGPPGTGKTYISEKLALHLIGGGDGFYKLIQFHPEVSYEDFIQGIRPKPLPEGGLQYPIVKGRFMEFCEEASKHHDLCVLIIDEINRANLARVFGELMYLLEYRNKDVELSAGNIFRIPDNVRIIGTMNTADRSIALVDHALRRRFAFLPLYPDYEILKKYHSREKTRFKVEGLISVLEDLNKQIMDRHFTIGPSYFLRIDIKDQIEDIWKMEIEPYLEEYFFDQQEKYQNFCWDKVSTRIMG